VRILIADDDPVTRASLETILAKQHYDMTIAHDGMEAWSILQQDDAPTLAILDWMMPGLDGPELCRRVREADSASYTYIVMLTGKDAKEDLVLGLDAGADDFLSKPFHSEELRARLRAGERILRLESELRVQARRDHLTGLFNRQSIFEILQRELAHAARGGKAPAVILADVDHFKRVNDTWGHPIGDAVLRETAARLHAVLRDYDAVGRYGGEEFMLVLRECDAGSVREVAERIRRSFCDVPIRTESGDVGLTISLGYAVARRLSSMEDVISAADAALYAAKHSGRNCVCGSVANDAPLKVDTAAAA
jgi:diguanylate cyclase (GGDEF)-like protein